MTWTPHIATAPRVGAPSARLAALRRLVPTALAPRAIAAELLLWALLYGAYLSIRGLAIASEPTAMSNARGLVDLERALGLFREADVQSALSPLAWLLSAYYMAGFIPVVVTTLLWLAWTRPAAYRRLRAVLLVSIALASVVHVLLPTAPPRLVEGLGLSDWVGLSAGHDEGSFMGISFNPYAAMPSMHVGWSLLIGIAGARAASSRLARIGFAMHPVVMTVVVVATGNHYVLDAVAGVVVVGAATVLIRVARRGRASDPGRK